jgi:hypothetical protein
MAAEYLIAALGTCGRTRGGPILRRAAVRLRMLEAKNILSFDDFALPFDPKLTVVVGPNGSGETNVVRLLDLMLAPVTSASSAETRSSPSSCLRP